MFYYNIAKKLPKTPARPESTTKLTIQPIDDSKTAANAGTAVVVANGKTNNVLLKILNNEEIGTIFYPSR